MALERELKTYQQKLPELLEHEGQFVLIHGNKVLGVLDTYEAALHAGYKKIGLKKPFFIRRIEAVESPMFFSRRVSS